MFGPSSDHYEIRSWAAEHNARPAQLHIAVFDSEPARLHFVFGELPLETDSEIHLISWETFFALFDELRLVLVSTGSPGRTRFELLKRQPQAGDAAKGQ